MTNSKVPIAKTPLYPRWMERSFMQLLLRKKEVKKVEFNVVVPQRMWSGTLLRGDKVMVDPIVNIKPNY